MGRWGLGTRFVISKRAEAGNEVIRAGSEALERYAACYATGVSPDEERLMVLKGEAKKNHHHVWQKYLSAWEDGSAVTCLQEGRIFTTGTPALGVKKHLYRLKSPSDEDLRFLARICFPEDMDPFLRDLNVGWLPIFFAADDLERLADLTGGREDAEIQKVLEMVRSNSEEDLHMVIERDSASHLDRLRGGDLTFLGDPDQRGRFLHFLTVQDFRTLGKREHIVRSAGAIPGVDLGNVIAPMTHIFATNVALGLLRRWDSTVVTLERSNGEVEFITSDQPVFNLHGLDIADGELVDELKYFFPLSPSAALTWDAHGPENAVSEVAVDADRVREANRHIFSASWSQCYARREDELRAI